MAQAKEYLGLSGFFPFPRFFLFFRLPLQIPQNQPKI